MDWEMQEAVGELEGYVRRNGYEVVKFPYRASVRTSPFPGRDVGGWVRCVVWKDGKVHRMWWDGRWKRS